MRKRDQPEGYPIARHKDIQTTMDIYAEATEQKKQESFERLAATLGCFLISEEGLLLSISSDRKFFQGQQIDIKYTKVMVNHEGSRIFGNHIKQ